MIHHLNEAAGLLKMRRSLGAEEMAAAMELIVTGASTDADIEAFLLALREKGETASEVASAARVMRRHSTKFPKKIPGLLDTCGTGGDAQHTLNVSTLSALVAVSAGARVAKHGNRSVSSVCGSADLLELLGVPLEMSPEKIAASIEKTGFGFLFAPAFHPATRYAMPARKKIQGKTIFNLLGPLCNPAGVDFQVIGVYSPVLVRTVAEVLAELGVQKAFVVHGTEGLDEISIAGATLAAEINRKEIRFFEILPESAGLKRSKLIELKCNSKEASLTMAKSVLRGEKSPARDAVALNAGAALAAAGLADSIKAGVTLSQDLLESGRVQKKLDEIIAFTG